MWIYLQHVLSSSIAPTSGVLTQKTFSPTAHDENLVFHLTAELSVVQPAKLAAKLVELLGTYHPAVAGFPWDLGDSQYHGMTELRAAFTHEPVAPLTGFENGMVIYHHTVVDFFFVRLQFRLACDIFPSTR